MSIPRYMIPHYSKLDTTARNRLLMGPNIVEEKYDGYSLYFARENGELVVSTKQRDGVVEEPMAFSGILPSLHELPLEPNATYYGEYLPRCRMVDITYERPAKGDIVLWDVRLPDGSWLPPKEKYLEAQRLGLDCARWLATDCTNDENVAATIAWLTGKHPSFPKPNPLLGGDRMEGFIIKNYEYPQKGGLPTVAKVIV